MNQKGFLKNYMWIFLAFTLILTSCATTQSPLREKDAAKRIKERDKDLRARFKA